MKVGFAGDWHGNVKFALEAISHLADEGCSRIIQVGDFGFWPGLEGDAYLNILQAACVTHKVDLYIVRGNHDDPTRWANYELDDKGFGLVTAIDIVRDEPNTSHPFLHFVPDGHVWEWEGKLFGSLGGAASIDRGYRQRQEHRWGKTWWEEEMILPEHVQSLVSQTRLLRADDPVLDVLCTHEGPSWSDLDHHMPQHLIPTYDLARAAMCRALVDMAAEMTEVRLHVHGHWHQRATSKSPWGGEVIVLDADVNGSLADNVYVLDI